MSFTQADRTFMARAIELAKQGRFTTTPNPNVGCVIVNNGEIVGEGFHLRAGEPHAEVHALREAAEQAQGATAYVTLEPCSHYGRTPPCAKGLIEAGVSKVIAAMVDPNPEVAGRGLTMLNDAGIETASGLLEEQARALNKGFLKRMELGLPYVICKLAASLDGKTALGNGESKWITGPAARRDVQLGRAQSCAILTGADTVLVDDARLNVRAEELTDIERPVEQWRQPVRVIIDSQNRLHPELALFKIAAPVVILRSDLDNQHNWPHFVEQIKIKIRAGKIDLHAALAALAERNINQVWLEGGATLAGAMHQQGLIDEYLIYLAPKIIGTDGKDLFNSAPLQAMSQVTELTLTEMTPIGTDIRITAHKKGN
ncbi:bifunctional diaminohydroxyphosphoribosylaminopyrimidine deaminase/5-amino-6-(5-phosphoribosylamino)uracil reductase RibD [Pseudoalteromonas sp. R3]|uniref:bifunctional diaminohydroxyphosphoribosylaminopyrimidine deaminase/5-amino-6-(5-phosphoribosylamino)uracil reductase RibD n=1 Tax=Pseudoalteromonas sp. R3 TaxID=1709477 RepID=UPI0006B41412|nr:bifunctional diaminohydroxyphosphoribosylaminopyrimidine deaminase/5-amino-6-(5-phosphoribosylamino)uracil reductase RibD [Pseudoalteromonas sp. R3]AZZ99176.1 bifunctional diaminohydroxyphosphoribosylaminopyrimidine deaminase/5-amino-6-(5-phosphoribosylamino)uracil reductase RibD [Pseudoalteromonas sp. R3]